MSKMNRYLLFSGNYFYPAGGWQDFNGSFPSVLEARLAIQNYIDWYHVVDSKTRQKVFECKDVKDRFAHENCQHRA